MNNSLFVFSCCLVIFFDILLNILKEFACEDNWDYILSDNEIIGLKKLHDTITLEPGSQVELSLEPKKTIKDILKPEKPLPARWDDSTV